MRANSPILVLVLCVFFGTALRAEETPVSLALSRQKKSAVLDDAGRIAEKGPFYIDLAFTYEAIGNIKRGGMGFAFDCGFNLGKLFRKDIIIAPFIGISPLFGGISYGDGFVGAVYEDWYNGQKNIDMTSLDKDSFSRAILAMSEGSILGATKLCAGLALQLPLRYAPPVKIYGLYYYVLHRKGGGWNSSGGYEGSDTTSHHYGVGAEVAIFQFRKDPASHFGSFNSGDVSIYVDYFDLEWTDINNDLFVSSNDPVHYRDVLPGLLSKYPCELIVGLKVGFCLR